MFKYIILLVAGFLPAFSVRPAGNPPPAVLRETRLMLGTVVSVELVAAPPGAAEEILKPFWEEAVRLESLLSRHNSESELSRVNRSAARGWVEVGPELIEVLSRALQVGELSGGAFDVTVGPLMELWGFFPRREGAFPRPGEIESALEKVDWRAVEICRERNAVRLVRPGIELDLGGIAKGYIVDRLVDFLRERGISDAMVNAGGDIYCLGGRPGGGPWRIGVENPESPGRAHEILELFDAAVATSGSYHNYFIRDLRRYSHIIDPRTGRPVDGSVEAVTVIASECALADALATAILVLGTDDGLELIEELPGVEALMVLKRNGELDLVSSAGWPGVKMD